MTPGPPRLGPTLQRLYADEQGVSLALVAISLVWLVGMAALVVDVGDGWLGRQTLVAASDAAALAAAQDLVTRPWDVGGACATAGGYVAVNAPSATVTDCEVVSLGLAGGRVTVGVDQELDANLVEVSEGASVGSVSSAAWGPPSTVTALRPFALCYDGSAGLRDVIDDPPTWPTWVVVSYVPDDPSACGGSPDIGNFATIDFETGTGDQEIRNWMINGYPGQVAFDGFAPTGCDGTVVCYDRPYASGAIRPELQILRSTGEYILFPVFDYVDATEVHLVGMVRARLYAYQLDGLPSTWEIQLKVVPGLVAGTCCGPPDLLAGNEVVAICGVDPMVYDACEADAG